MCTLSGLVVLVHNLPKESPGQSPAIRRHVQEGHLFLMVSLLQCRRIAAGLLDAPVRGGRFVEGIRDGKALGPNVPVPQCARSPRVVVAG